MLTKVLRVFAIASLGAIAATAFAQDKLSKGDKKWVEKEVGPIITKQEIAIFNEIRKDDRKLFKELFWIRRDFNPNTPENEFRKDYEARFKTANQIFKGRRQKGSETDRGKIFLLLGSPNRQALGRGAEAAGPGAATSGSSNADPTGEGPGGGSGSGGGGEAFDPNFGARGSQNVTWIYDPKPDLGIPDGLAVEFRQQAQFGLRLTNLKEIQERLERVKERLIANPAISYARDENGRLKKPDDKYDPNSPARVALAALRETGEVSSDVTFTVKPIFFEASGGQTFVPTDIIITGGLSGKKATIFGSVENADGFEIHQFVESAEISEDSGGQKAFEIPFQFMPGLYTLYVGVMDDKSQLIGSQIMDLEVPSFDSEELTMSSVLLFTDREQVGEASPQAGRAFLVAGSHLTPKRATTYRHSEDISGIFYEYNFGDEPSPNLSVQYYFFREGQKRGQTADSTVDLINENFFVIPFGFPLSLKNFEAAGNYTIEIKLTDHVTGETMKKEIAFTIADE